MIGLTLRRRSRDLVPLHNDFALPIAQRRRRRSHQVASHPPLPTHCNRSSGTASALGATRSAVPASNRDSESIRWLRSTSFVPPVWRARSSTESTPTRYAFALRTPGIREPLQGLIERTYWNGFWVSYGSCSQGQCCIAHREFSLVV